MSRETDDLFDALPERLSTLATRRVVAFAATCAERALAEIRRIPWETIHDEGPARTAIDLAWAFALGAAVDDARSEEVWEALFDEDDDSYEGTLASSALVAVDKALEAFRDPDNAPEHGETAGFSVVDIVANAYEDGDAMERAELRWQIEALRRLSEPASDSEVSRTLFESIPEYERSPLKTPTQR